MTRWLARFGIVVLTAAWLIWELWSNFDGDSSTWPLTWVIIYYVPTAAYFPAVCLLAVWLVWHFWPGAHRGRPNRTQPPEGIMSVPATPAHVKRDAAVRAVRTFVQGLVVTAVAAAGAGLAAALSDGVKWTPEYPKAILASVAASVALAVTSYVSRYIKTPANAPS